MLGIAAFWQGELDAARGHFEAAVARYRPEQRGRPPPPLRAGPRGGLPDRAWRTRSGSSGDAETAARARERTLALADEMRPSRTAARSRSSSRRCWRSTCATSSGCASRRRPSGPRRPRHGARQLRIPPRCSPASSTCSTAMRSEGIARVRPPSGRRAAGEPAAPGEAGMIARVLLEACALAGDARQGLAVADRALELGMGALVWEAESRRLRASSSTPSTPRRGGRGGARARRRGRRAPGRAGVRGARAAEPRPLPRRNALRNARGTARPPRCRPGR